MAPLPKFLAYAREDHAQAARTPYIRDLIEFLRWDQQNGIDSVLRGVRDRRFDEAFYFLAKADACGELVDIFEREDLPEAPAEEPEPFDPALPPSLRRP